MRETFFLRNLRYLLPIGIVVTIVSYFFDKPVAEWARTLPSSIVQTAHVVEILCATMPHLVLWPSIFFCFLVFGKKRRAAKTFLLLSVAIAVSYLICYTFKGVLGRARPELLFTQNIYGFFYFTTNFSYQAFPSGHSTTISAFFGILSCFFPRCSLPFLGLALLMAFSRVVTETHFLSDIFGGVLLGTLASQWVYSRLKSSFAWPS